MKKEKDQDQFVELFDHFSVLNVVVVLLRSSRYLSVRPIVVLRSVGILSSQYYIVLHNSRRLASYLLLYAGPSTSCFLQGVREQREGEAKGKLKRSARIYSRPDRGQKGEPCRPFPPDAGTPNTSQADKVNEIRWRRNSIHHVLIISDGCDSQHNYAICSSCTVL